MFSFNHVSMILNGIYGNKSLSNNTSIPINLVRFLRCLFVMLGHGISKSGLITQQESSMSVQLTNLFARPRSIHKMKDALRN